MALTRDPFINEEMGLRVLDAPPSAVPASYNGSNTDRLVLNAQAGWSTTGRRAGFIIKNTSLTVPVYVKMRNNGAALPPLLSSDNAYAIPPDDTWWFPFDRGVTAIISTTGTFYAEEYGYA